MNAVELKALIQEILIRVDEASSGARNTDDWHDEEDNRGAPNGMSYWGWIEEAEKEAVKAVDKLITGDKL